MPKQLSFIDVVFANILFFSLSSFSSSSMFYDVITSFSSYSLVYPVEKSSSASYLARFNV
jgi:hypothetical protein